MARWGGMNSHETNNLLTLTQPKTLPLALILILILSFLINVYGIWWGLPSYRGWAPDEIIPGKVFNGVIKGFSNGWHERHPPLHFYFLAILYSPFIALHLLNVIDVRSLPTYTVLFYLGRFLSVLMGTGTVLVVYLCGREIYDQKASLFAALITALICPFVHFSKTANLDVPYIFWFTLSLLFYVRVLKHHKVNDYLLFAVTAVMSICTKDQAYGFYILTSVFIVLSHYRYEKQRNSEARMIDSFINRKILLSLLLAVVLFLTLHNVLFNLDGFLAHIRLITGGDFYRSLSNICEHVFRAPGNVLAESETP